METQKQYDDEKRFVLFTNSKTDSRQADRTGKGQLDQKKYRLACWNRLEEGRPVLSGKVSPEGSFDDVGTFTLRPNPAKEEGSKHPDWKGEITIGQRTLALAAWKREGRSGEFLSGRIEEMDAIPTSTRPREDVGMASKVEPEEIPF